MQPVADLCDAGGAIFAAQSVFRNLMDAAARPGSIVAIAPAENAPARLSPAVAALALALFDHDTPIWLDPSLRSSDETISWLRFRTGGPIVDDPSRCAFALAADGAALPRLDAFALGTPDYPDRSTTLMLQLPSLCAGPELSLSGPGIRGAAALRPAGLPEDFVTQHAAIHALFPRGIDLVLVAANEIAVLPRTTAVERA